ncbi:hypothetical protein ABB37_02305 [Leptomonas pyrrhocoris]|uniref:Rab-GAP TBC domain-containing protein n=1 Tax=Leptomonas pyrrhocoris TaxID=157538 RepID=A0A0N0DYL7_LEPPY|nr:hypothetical protein ABB37_02305 [Leptomonas pyrrhocoris]KPA84272.1 hypothetical protein ABB37_02305 [Leptomonas pyrrhocoris]|eukprot:XP_015662711.1 hypothetical protein ABB37_02305 [Leptomonas pyrrhocoris]
MNRLSRFVAEEDGVVALPLCVWRLRGPGRARRLPPGSTYRSAGAVLRRVLLYNEHGQARVQVVRSDGLDTPREGSFGRLSSTKTTSTTAAVAETWTTATGAPTAALASRGMSTPAGGHDAGPVAEGRDEGGDAGRSAPMASSNAKEALTKSQLRRERASTLVAETERRYEEAQESSLASLLQTLPLLRVVPPLSLQQQAYTRETLPSTTAGPTHTAVASHNTTGNTINAADAGFPASSRSAMNCNTTGSTNILTSNVLQGHASPTALRAAQARYGGGGGSGAQQSAAMRDGRRLRLSSAIVLSQEETALMAVNDAPRGQAGATTTTADPLPLAAASAGQRCTSPPPPSSLPSPSPSLKDAVLLPLATDTTAAAAAAPDTQASPLRDIFIDGGLGVTIKLGSSCDEPNSLRCVAWGGCRPAMLRAVIWRLLSDYAPAQVARQHTELQRKRRQYEGYTRQYCSALTMLAVSEASAASSPSAASTPQLSAPPLSSGFGGAVHLGSVSLSRLPVPSNPHNFSRKSPDIYNPSGRGGTSSNVNVAAAASLAPHERAILHQMLLDLPRHQSPVFHARRAVAGMARCLFLWSQRHPAVGYVQGMDDVVAVFYQVFLTDALRQHAREQLARWQRQRRCSSTSLPQSTMLPPPALAFTEAADVENSGDDNVTAAGAEEAQGGSDRSTRDIMHFLLASVHPHRPPTSASVPSTPNSVTAAATAESAAALSSSVFSSASASLSPFLTEADVDVRFRTSAALDAALADLPESYLTQVEADTYFCAGRMLSFLQDNFMTGQPGILRGVRRLESLVRVVDPAVVTFLGAYGLTVMDGCFQWLHCLLARELPLSLLLRLWDCYLAIGVGGDQPMGLSASPGMSTSAVHASTSTSGSGGGGAASSSDEAVMYFHVCVCCALLRALCTNLMGGAAAAPSTAAPTTTPASPGTMVGGWAAALVTALPSFRTRAPQNSGEGGGDAAAAAALRAKPSIDVVMTTMKRPFEALFPKYPSTAVRQQRLDAELQGGVASRGTLTRQTSPSEESSEAAAAERWLDLLIADAYCIWRLHPLSS